MVEELLHPLRDWRRRQQPRLTMDAAASAVGTTRQTWYDWEIGRRIPDRSYMPKIYRFTRGAVTANDFYFPYGLPDLDQPSLPLGEAAAPAPLLEPEREWEDAA
jgi:transcriptional regulator with XRE-family HTH domain